MTQFVKRNTGARKLNLAEVEQIRKHYGEGATQSLLGKMFNISVVQIGRIVRGESWPTGAGSRALSPLEAEKILQSALALQERLKENPDLVMPASVPPSLLDGGDAPDETGGAGVAAALEKASAYGVDIDRLLK